MIIESRQANNNAPRTASNQKQFESFYVLQWRVLPCSNELVCETSNERIVLEPRLMQLLCLLAASPYGVVSRTELSDQLWPHVIVNENSLTRAVSSLRSKLKRLSSDATLIETIPKRGYRLNASIENSDLNASTPIRAQIEGNIKPRSDINVLRWTPRPLVATAASILLASVLALAISSNTLPASSQNQQMPLADIAIENISTVASLGQASVNHAVALQSDDNFDQHLPKDTVMSQDGNFFAYIKPERNSTAIIVGSVTSPEQAVTVFSTQDAIANLQWSPIKRALLFAQSARISTAVLSGKEQESSLVMFDLETFTSKVLDGPLLDSINELDHVSADKVFNLT